MRPKLCIAPLNTQVSWIYSSSRRPRRSSGIYGAGARRRVTHRNTTDCARQPMFRGRVARGEAARLYGGRFNPVGQPAVYLSEQLSLSAIETLVHIGVDERQLRYGKFAVEVPDSIVHRVTIRDLPDGWDARPPGPTVQRWGGELLARYGVLCVPSVIIPEECNVIINPTHESFECIGIGPSEGFCWDGRLALPHHEG